MLNLLRLALPVALVLAVVGAVSCKKDEQESALGKLYDAEFAFKVEDYLRAAREGRADIIRWFLECGMEPDSANQFGDRALMLAAERGHGEIVVLLLEAGAEADGGGPGGRTALIGAAEAGSSVGVRALLAKGADPKHRDAEGWTALRRAAFHGHAAAAELLVPHAAPAEIDSALLLAAVGGDVATLDRMFAAGADVYRRTPDGQTALMVAAARGHWGAAKLLMDRGANRFATDRAGRTAVQLAADAGASEVVQLLDDGGEPELAGQPLASLDGAEVEHPGTVWRLEGARVEALPEAGQPLRMERYREAQLPVALEAVDAETGRAGLRRLHGAGEMIWVNAGDVVPGTPFFIVTVNRKVAATKGSAGEVVDLQSATVRDQRSGREFVMTPEDPGLSVYSYVDLTDARGRSFRGRRGDTFEVTHGEVSVPFRILELRPREVLIERLDNGEVITLAKAAEPEFKRDRSSAPRAPFAKYR